MKNPFEKPKEPQQPRQLTQKDFDYERIFTERDEPRESPLDRLRSLATPIRAAIVVGLIIFIVVVTVIRHQFDPPGAPGEEVSLEIPAGATTGDVLDQLAAEGVINSAFAMRLWMRIERDGSDQFQAGEYTFHKNTAVGGALAVLRSGPDSLTESIVIPEGETVEEIAVRIGRLPGMTANRFRELAGLTGTPSSVRSALQPSDQQSLEGFLFPDTYFIDSADTEETMLSRMVNRFDTVARQTGLDQAERAIQRSSYDALILASMVESEAQIDQDRGKISQVIQNRLVQDTPLQIDATLIYGLGGNRTGVSLQDTRTPSPYNSYLNKGLPPTPISNPGTESIEAALAPDAGPWLFYVRTEANGAHTFAVTGEEHERNVEIARQRGFVE